MDPDAKLDEPLIVRPTSETIIWDTYSRWIQSWRDLPILINQWANVVRWEMRTRLFLRTSEFLWQEGHTAHATEQEAIDEARQMLDVYATFAEDWMAMPVIKGIKTESERFPGAVDTFAIEALMQDGKALQAGTSHFLGQNFAKAFDCMFTNKDNEQEYVWATSWGVSTRLVGGLVMTHGDDQGLVLPPRLAPTQVVVVPIYRANKEDDKQAVMEVVERIERELRVAGVRVKVDAREEHRPGWKFHEYEVQGVPLRLAVGPRDVKNQQVELSRRDQGGKDFVPLDTLAATVTDLLSQIQRGLFNKAASFRDSKTTKADSYDDFKDGHRAGRLRARPLGRHRRDRSSYQRGDEGHDPRGPLRARGRNGEGYAHRRAIRRPRPLRPLVLRVREERKERQEGKQGIIPLPPSLSMPSLPPSPLSDHALR